MSLLIAHGIEKSFGALTVLRGVSLRLEWRQRIGLVGPNGCGKTTLLRILARDTMPDRGRVAYARGLGVGYLRQEQMVDHGLTVYQEAEAAFAHVLEMERSMRSMETRMSSLAGAELDDAMESYGVLHGRFEAMGGYDALRDVRKVLRKLGFAEADFDRTTERLSGGEKTRLALAKLLLSGPDVLLLDEPTNHLDLAATEWLEEFLCAFGGSLLLVSHDRRFLDNVVTSVTELEDGSVSHYRGDFTAYWDERQRRREKLADDVQRRQAEIERLEEFWRRNKAGQNRNMAWSRLKAADRLRAQQPDKLRHDASVKLALSSGQRSGNEVVIAERLTKRYGERTLFNDTTLLVTRGQRIGIVGPNGSGKSTFLRIVIGEEPPTAGRVRLGASVTLGYFAQEASGLDPSLSVIETLLLVRDMLPGDARSFLARFLFTGDDVFKTVEMLSGGEKNRLVLAQLVLEKPNLLVLDEPTNHLDIAARDALTRTLKSYDGTLLLASHDRHLLDAVTDLTLEFASGRARMFDGSYTAYRRQIARDELVPKREEPPASISPVQPRHRNSFELARARKRSLREVESAERAVAESEDLVGRIEEALSHPMPGDDIVRLSRDYEHAQASLQDAMKAWEAAVTDAEDLGAAI